MSASSDPTRGNGRGSSRDSESEPHPRPFTFAERASGRPSTQLLPPIKDLDSAAELTSDDILESEGDESQWKAPPPSELVVPITFDDHEVAGSAPSLSSGARSAAPSVVRSSSEPMAPEGSHSAPSLLSGEQSAASLPADLPSPPLSVPSGSHSAPSRPPSLQPSLAPAVESQSPSLPLSGSPPDADASATQVEDIASLSGDNVRLSSAPAMTLRAAPVASDSSVSVLAEPVVVLAEASAPAPSRTTEPEMMHAAGPPPPMPSMQPSTTATLFGMPAARDAGESGASAEPLSARSPSFAATLPAPALTERTLELTDTAEKVASAAAFLDGDIQEHTELLDSPSVPPFPRQGPIGYTPPPSSAMVATVPAWAHGRSTSVGPVAMDVSSVPRPTLPSIAPAEARVYAPPPTAGNRRGLWVVGAVLGIGALIGAAGLGGYLASRKLTMDAVSAEATAAKPSVAGLAASAPTANAEPLTNAVPASPAAMQPPPAATQASNGSPEVDVSALPASRTPSKGTMSGGASKRAGTGVPNSPKGQAMSPPLPASPAETVVALPPPPPKPVVVAPVSTTGRVLLDPSNRTAVVDGAFQRVNGGVLTLSCGMHRIKVGMASPRAVNVPCGGSVTF